LKELLEKLSIYTKQSVSDPQILWGLIGIDYHLIKRDNVQAILDFESREYGCIGAMSKAFVQMLNDVASEDLFNIKDARTPEQQADCVKKIEARMLNFHRLCTENVYGLNEATEPGKYRQTKASYTFQLNLNPPNGTNAGYTYLNLKPAIRGHRINGETKYLENFYGLRNKIDGSFEIICCAKIDEIALIAQYLIHRLIQDLQQYRILEYQKLLYVCEFIQDMMLLHPFADANNRVLVNLLLNEILIDIGFSPVMFNQPNIFDGFSPNELVHEIYKGQTLLKSIVNDFQEVYDKDLRNNYRRLLTVALRNDSSELLAVALTSVSVPDKFKDKFSAAVADFRIKNLHSPKLDLLHDIEFLNHFLGSYKNQRDVVYWSSVILTTLLDCETFWYLSWQFDFFVKYFFQQKIEERIIIDGYFHALMFVVYNRDQVDDENTLLDILFKERGNSGNTLYKSSKNKTYIIFRCIDWYTHVKGLNNETKRSISNLSQLLDQQESGGAKLSYEDVRKIEARIENVFSQRRSRFFSI
jgi:hypothetical protein